MITRNNKGEVVNEINDPSSWDDSNDSYYLTLYKEKRKVKSLLALCFTESDERYHYWRVFAPGASGVCIRFNRSELLAAVGKQSGLQMKPVSYLTLDDLRNKKRSVRSRSTTNGSSRWRRRVIRRWRCSNR